MNADRTRSPPRDADHDAPTPASRWTEDGQAAGQARDLIFHAEHTFGQLAPVIFCSSFEPKVWVYCFKGNFYWMCAKACFCFCCCYCCFSGGGVGGGGESLNLIPGNKPVKRVTCLQLADANRQKAYVHCSTELSPGQSSG